MTTYYQRNRDQIIEKQRARDALRKDEIAEYQKAYRTANAASRKVYHAKYYEDNKEELKQRQAEYYLANREYCILMGRMYYQLHRDCLKAAGKVYYDSNRDRILLDKKAYYFKNKEDFIRRNAGRRANEKAATPKWANKREMSLIYARATQLSNDTGIIHHVHHIVPLKDHSSVCGLHCEANLTVLTIDDHWRLHSDPERLEESWGTPT